MPPAPPSRVRAPRPAVRMEPAVSPARPSVLPLAERSDARLAALAEPDVRREMLRLHDTINQLHRQRRRLREDRDRWERLSRELERELVSLRDGEQRGAASPLVTADKFRRAKMVLARLTHPDANGASGIEADIRASLFQEFWAEFERIEAEASARTGGFVRH